jgi:predicted RNA methylase
MSQTQTAVGSIIPIQYHHNMLMDQARMEGFKQAIQLAVKSGMNVLELGAGSGVMSFFAAQQGAKVTCVELLPEVANSARDIIKANAMADRVEVICEDGFKYVPEKKVDVVICEMVHAAMLREKQIEMITYFKLNYLEKFGPPLPVFIPSAAIMAVQPVHQDYDFYGYRAAVPIFQQANLPQSRTKELGQPVTTHIMDYSKSLPDRMFWNDKVTISEAGDLNAIRFVTKNILAIDQEKQTTVDWFSQYLVMPLKKTLKVEPEQKLTVTFDYSPGAEITELQRSLAVLV